MLKFSIEKEAYELQNDTFAIPQQPEYHKLISKVYKNKILYAKQYKNDKVTHILPFAIVSNVFLGKKIVSMPYDGSFGGTISLSECDISDDLYYTLIKFAKENKVKFIEIRMRGENKQLERMGFIKNISLIISEVELADICNNKYIKKKKKNNKLATKYGIKVEIANNSKDMKRFYKIMSTNMRSYGTPMYPYRYFKKIWDCYSKKNKMILIKGSYKGKMVSGLLLLLSGKTAVLKYSATLKKYISKRCYPSMKWFAMDLCKQEKCEILNMGTAFVNDKGLISAKEGLGAKTIPLVTYNLNFCGQNHPLSVYQNKFRFIIKLWKYQPLRLSQWLGELFWKWFC